MRVPVSRQVAAGWGMHKALGRQGRHRSENSGSSWDTWVRLFTNPSFPPGGRSPTLSTLILLLSFVVGFAWILAGIVVLLGSS